MIKFLRWFFGLFSPYVNSFEHKVDKFFKSIKSNDSHAEVRKGLLNLMQENLIVTNVWMEKKFKGYKYLNKKTRRVMYEDVKKIVAKFQHYSEQNRINQETLKQKLDHQGLTFPHGDEDKLLYLAQIMAFLKPGQHYHYINTASFGKLLRDPDHAKLEGDCNQIVTLYIYLFSLKFSLDLLQIKLLPEHVCLHFHGIDIEATNGTFQKYEDDKQILPVTEIISTNLLDLTDFREEVQKIEPQIIVKSSQLAYAISSLHSIVAKNLDIAYRNLAIDSMTHKNFERAIFYAEKGSDRKLLNNVYHNAAVYYMEVKNFAKARFLADKSENTDLVKTVQHNEGIYYYQNDKIDKALMIFANLGDEKMKKACYQKEYSQLHKKVANVKTVADAKRYKSTYQKMLDLAQKMDDDSLVRNVRETLKHI